MTGLELIPWSALTGLAGTWLGHRLSTHQRHEELKSQQVYEDNTRFHADRLQAYAALLSAQSELAAAASVCRKTDDWEPGEGKVRSELNRYLDAAGLVTLLASEPVKRAVNELWPIIYRFQSKDIPNEDAPTFQVLAGKSNEVRDAMRRELGISPADVK